MSSHQATSLPRTPAKSPILAAIGISLAIAIGTTLGTLDTATIEDALTGKWLTRDYTETQQGQTVAIAALENSVGSVTREIDFIAARVGGSIRRNEHETLDRFALLDAQIVELKDRISGIQNTRLVPPRAPDAPPNAQAANARDPQVNEMTGLRSSLHDLTSAHHNAVTEITKRLDRIEVMVGLTTDMTSSVSDPVAHKAARRAATSGKQPSAATSGKQQSAARAVEDLFAPTPTGTRPDRGHIFSVKPISQQISPLRGSKMPG
jgi:hypothetical protein